MEGGNQDDHGDRGGEAGREGVKEGVSARAPPEHEVAGHRERGRQDEDWGRAGGCLAQGEGEGGEERETSLLWQGVVWS